MIFSWYFHDIISRPSHADCPPRKVKEKGKGREARGKEKGEGYYYDITMIIPWYLHWNIDILASYNKYNEICFFFFCGRVTIDSRPYDSKSTFSHDITMIFSWYFHEIISIISLLWPHPGFVVLDALQWDITMILLWSFHDFYKWNIDILAYKYNQK